MRANYHTHTWRCRHAQGREEDYVKTAILQGFDILGFADHSPYFFPGEYYSTYRMGPEQLPGYCDTVRSLQKQFQHRIRIPLGLELEYYPDLIHRVLPVLRDQGIEYLLLGQHFVGNEVGEHYSGAPTADERILRRYCRQAMDAMQTGLFTYFAHPDLIYYTGDPAVYRRHMTLLCREAKSCGMPLEMNMLGQWARRNYPNPLFWELAAEEGCTAILGWDAHDPTHLEKIEQEQQLRTMAARLGIPVLQQAVLRPVIL